MNGAGGPEASQQIAHCSVAAVALLKRVLARLIVDEMDAQVVADRLKEEGRYHLCKGLEEVDICLVGRVRLE